MTQGDDVLSKRRRREKDHLNRHKYQNVSSPLARSNNAFNSIIKFMTVLALKAIRSGHLVTLQ